MYRFSIHDDQAYRQGWPTLCRTFDTLDEACQAIVSFPPQYRIERAEYDEQQRLLRTVDMLFWDGKHLHATRQGV